MNWLKENHKKSQLGQLLLKKKLISEDQLNRAIDLQKNTGQLLGDIFTELDMVTQRQIQSILRKQRNLRRIATIITALLGPAQVYAASAAPIPAEQTSQAQTSSPAPTQQSLRMLNEEELAEVVGKGVLDETLSDWLNLKGSANNSLALQNLTSPSFSMAAKQTTGLLILGDLVTVMDPFLALFSSQISARDVVYNPANAASVVNPDGSITLSLPSSIGELSFNNIRVMGSTGPNMGTVQIKGIDLAGTTVTLKTH